MLPKQPATSWLQLATRASSHRDLMALFLLPTRPSLPAQDPQLFLQLNHAARSRHALYMMEADGHFEIQFSFQNHSPGKFSCDHHPPTSAFSMTLYYHKGDSHVLQMDPIQPGDCRCLLVASCSRCWQLPAYNPHTSPSQGTSENPGVLLHLSYGWHR